jgi:hypothetical protein
LQLERWKEGKRRKHFAFLFIKEVLEHFLLVNMDPVVVKQDMDYCGSCELLEVSECGIRIMLGCYASGRRRAPDGTTLPDLQAQQPQVGT